MLRLGSKGVRVRQLQILLNLSLGLNLYTDGIFGQGTHAAVLRFQRQNGLVQDGIVGSVTMGLLELKSSNKAIAKSKNPDPDVFNSVNLLNRDEYQTSKPHYVGATMHHTVSGGNPNDVVNNWEYDNREAATNVIIGREEVDGSDYWDGHAVLCIPKDCWGFHLALTRMGYKPSWNFNANKMYWSFEICSWGALKKVGGKFFDLSGRIQIPEYQVCKLQRPFRTFRYWHKFTDAQLHKTFQLLNWFSCEYSIDFTDTSSEPIEVNADWLELDWKALNLLRKLTTHSNFEAGKFDVFPQPELLEVIRSIYNGNKSC